MLNRLDLRGAGDDLVRRLPRPQLEGEQPVAAVQEILADVRARGDAAVRDATRRFDGAIIDDLRVPVAEVERALESIPAGVRDALETAAANVTSFHREQVGIDLRHERHGVMVKEMRRPVGRAGCYVPGGRARYPSTVLMTAIPARVAGVPEVVVCVPPGPDGRVAAVTLAAAAVAGVDEVYRIGGVQAVGAMAYGTESVRPVDVIVGPGNLYVAVAKREVAGQVGTPSAFAGPSEVVVIADGATPVDFAAVDVVVQAEHGPDGLAWLVTWVPEVADAVSEAVAKVVAASPRRDDIESTLAANGYAVVVDGPQEAMVVANHIAPEHLQLMNERPDELAEMVRNAGAVFCGPWAPAAVGDYIAGPSHVLPTHGSARFSSALRVDDFLRHIHVITLDEAAMAGVAVHVAALAEAEGLTTHAEAARLRAAR